MEKYINADDFMAFCLYLMNKVWWNLIKIRSQKYVVLSGGGKTIEMEWCWQCWWWWKRKNEEYTEGRNN